MRVLINLDFDATPTKKDVENYLSELIADGSLDFTLDPEATPVVSNGIGTYRAICLNTGHLTQSDISALEDASVNPGMVLKRDTGFFIKLFDEIERDSTYSDDLNAIIEWGHGLGHRLIEFDSDALEIDTFPISEHWG